MSHFNRYLSEKTIILISIIKWVIISSLVGVITGTITSVFILLIDYTSSNSLNSYLILPVGLFLSYYIINNFATISGIRGAEKVINVIHTSSKFKLRQAFVEFSTAIITLASGGSSGKEGPAAFIGSIIPYKFFKLLKLSKYDRKKIAICGTSAAFSVVFGTPIAGAIFGVEVLFVGKLSYNLLLPALISGIIAYEISSIFGLEHIYYNIQSFDFSYIVFAKLIIISIIFGFIATLIIYTFKSTNKLFKKIKIGYLKPAIGSLILLSIFHYIPETRGLGYETFHNLMNGKELIWYFFIAKIITMSVTIHSGGGGGVITPLLLIGLGAGNFLAPIFNLDPMFLSSIGFVAILAGVTNTPIACMILSLELFGEDIVPYATLACIISYHSTGYRSIFPSQIISSEKSHSLVPIDGHSIEQNSFYFNYSSKKILYKIKSIFKK